jgi:hypothetical protein
MLEKIIRFNNVEVVKGLCTVAFRVETPYGNKELTHGNMYELLDTCTELIEPVGSIEKHFAILYQGIVKIHCYTL